MRRKDGDELKRLIDTHAPELNEPAESTDWEVEYGLRSRAETEESTQGRQPAEPMHRQ
jgi:hypothetical protein